MASTVTEDDFLDAIEDFARSRPDGLLVVLSTLSTLFEGAESELIPWVGSRGELTIEPRHVREHAAAVVAILDDAIERIRALGGFRPVTSATGQRR